MGAFSLPDYFWRETEKLANYRTDHGPLPNFTVALLIFGCCGLVLWAAALAVRHGPPFLLRSAVGAAKFAWRVFHAPPEPLVKLESTRMPAELSLGDGACWHLHISHHGDGEVCEKIKKSLSRLLPGVAIFLDLKSTDKAKEPMHGGSSRSGPPEEHVDRSQTVLIFVSKGYFTSKTCLREVRRAVEKRKTIALVYQPSRYYESQSERNLPLGVIKAEECPAELLVPVFGHGREVIPWHRSLGQKLGVRDFEQLSLKMIAQEVLAGCPQPVGLWLPRPQLYVNDERPLQRLAFRSTPVLFASENNRGAVAVVRDLQRGMDGHFEMTTELAKATHFMLYINEQTYKKWNREEGPKLIEELRSLRALRKEGKRIKVVCLHEQDDARWPCALGVMWDGRTPPDLLSDCIYSGTFCELSSGRLWPTTCAVLAAALGAHKVAATRLEALVPHRWRTTATLAEALASRGCGHQSRHFCTAGATREPAVTPHAAVRKMFAKYAGDDNYIDIDELRDLSKELGRSLTIEALALVMAKLCKANDDKVDYVDFVRWFEMRLSIEGLLDRKLAAKMLAHEAKKRKDAEMKGVSMWPGPENWASTGGALTSGNIPLSVAVHALMRAHAAGGVDPLTGVMTSVANESFN